jgi:hypothetical protein
MSADPPVLASDLLALVVPSRHRDGITGDLLEEYREVRLPEGDEASANAWYVRQLVACFWRAVRWWAVALGAIGGVRGVIDILVPTQDYYLRALWTTWLSISVLASCGVYAGWYYGHVRSGTILGVATGLMGSLAGLLPPLVFLGFGFGPGSSGLWEALDVPVPIIVGFGAVLGSLGAAVGKTGRQYRRVTMT